MQAKLRNLWHVKIMIPLLVVSVLISTASAVLSISLCSETEKNNQAYSLSDPIRYDKAWDSMDI